MPAFTGPITFADIATRGASIDLGSTPTQMRTGFHELFLGKEHEALDICNTTLGGVSCFSTHPIEKVRSASRVWVWLHGGGYVFGSPATHRSVAEAFAKTTGCPIVVPQYRLAPDHAWPAQLEDASAVVKSLARDRTEVCLIGDSAGGHLAINTALTCARNSVQVARLGLCSPNTDRSGLNATRAIRSAADPIVDDDFDTRLGKMCFGESLETDTQVSPVLAEDLHLLPRTHIEVGSTELLRDDSIALYVRAKSAGVNISLHETMDATHMWQAWVPYLSEGQKSLERLAIQLT